MKKLLILSLLLGAVAKADSYEVTFANGAKQRFASKQAAVTYLIRTGDKSKSIVEIRDVVFNAEKLSFRKAKHGRD